MNIIKNFMSGVAVVGGMVAFALTAASVAQANVITVLNPSFEILPQAGLPYNCGTGCNYSFNSPIPGWDTTGTPGQWQPGSFFNSVPDGLTIGFNDGGSLSQTVGVTSQQGVTYTLTVDLGRRNDGVAATGIEQLQIGGTIITATGTAPSRGDWSTYTASYTATTSGESISIILSSGGPQGDWDNVRLTDSVSATPLPAALPLFGTGLGVIGLLGWRRKQKQAAA